MSDARLPAARPVLPEGIASVPRLLRAGLGCLVLACALPVQAQSRQAMQSTYHAFLTAEGYRPEITSAGNISFKREGLTYFIILDESDPAFFKLSLRFNVEDKSPAMRQRRLEALNAVNRTTKVVKSGLDDDEGLFFHAEAYVASPQEATRHMPRMLRAVSYAYDQYLKRIRSGN